MTKLRDLPIRRKLAVIILCTSAVALVLALAFFSVFQFFIARASAASDLGALAQVIADNSAGAFAFDDVAAARKTLAALRVRPEIVQARLLDPLGGEFSRYDAGNSRAFSPPGGRAAGVDGFHVYVSQPVLLNGELWGTLTLVADVRGTLMRMMALTAGVLAGVLALALALGYLLARRMQRSIADPLLTLAASARRVGERNDYTVRATKLGNDEIGYLTDAFNRMLAEVEARDHALRGAQEELSRQVETLQHEIAERTRAEKELARTHEDLVEASRRAGQADVATAVLHNVGNVLNSVIVSATVAVDRIRASRVENVGRAGQLLLDHRDGLGPFFRDDPQGRVFLDYLPKLGEHLLAEQTTVLTELSSLAGNIEHIKGIIVTQQSYASVAGVLEMVSLADLVEQSLVLQGNGLARHHIEVVRHLEAIPAFPVDKHQVVQILVNLIRNAKDVLKTVQPSGGRRLEVALARCGKGRVQVRVADNGPGIAAENLTRIFQHGFTTRHDGHGFGLHFSALAARQMGGTLAVHSDGPGRGAVFALELDIDSSPT